MRNTGLEEAQTGIKIAGRNINNHRYEDDTTLMAESEQELKSLLMKVKEESEKVGLNIEKTKIMASSPISSVQFISVTQSCLTLCDTMDCSLPGSSVQGIFQAIILEWVAISSSRGSSWPRESSQSRDQTQVSWISKQILYHWAIWEDPYAPTMGSKRHSWERMDCCYMQPHRWNSHSYMVPNIFIELGKVCLYI